MNPKLIKKLLELSIDETNDLDEFDRWIILLYTTQKSSLALEVVLDFMKENFIKIDRM